MPEEKKKKERLCIVTGYGGSYYDGVATYSSEVSNAKIFKESEITDSIKNTPDHKIIFFDTKEGLQFLAEKYEDLQNHMEIYETRVKEVKESMKMLWDNSEKLRKYVEEYNKSYHQLMGVSEDTKRRILEEVVKEK